MPVLINNETGLADDLDQEAADRALASQTHEIPLNDPQGNPVSAPLDTAKDLLSQGHEQPSPKQLQSLLNHAKYSSTGQQIITGLEGAGAGLLPFGVTTAAEVASGITTPEAIRARAEENPITHGVSELGGFLASSLIPGVGASNVYGKAAKTLGIGAEGGAILSHITGDAVRGAFEGALYQGSTEIAKAFTQDPEQHAQSAIADIGLSAVLGGVVGGSVGSLLRKIKTPTAETVQKSTEKIAKAVQESSIENFQLERGSKALGFIKSQLNKLKGGEEEAKTVASTLLNTKLDSGEKIITPLSSTADIAEKVDRLIDESGSKIGNVYKQLDETGVKQLNPIDVAAKIEEKIGPEWRSPLNKAETGQLENTLEAVLMRGDQPISFSEANTLKQELQRAAYPKGYWGPDTPKMTIARGALGVFTSELDQAVDRAANEANIPKLLEHLQEQRKIYGAASKASRSIEDMLKREVGNNLFGLSDVIIGTGAGAGAGAIPAIASILTKRLVQKFGNQIIATSPAERLISIEKMIRSLGTSPEMEQAGFLAKATINGIKATDRAIKSVMNPEMSTSPAVVAASIASRDKIKKMVDEYTQNPEKMMNITSNIPVQEYKGSFAASSARAVQYLNTLKPKTDKMSPLDAEMVPSKSDEHTYNRAIDIAEKPLLVVESIKSGTLTQKDVVSLKTMYPNLYSGMAQKMHNEIINNASKGKSIPYSKRLSLSLFLGQSLDSTMTPQAILATQPKPSTPQTPSQVQAHAGHKGSMKSLDKLSNSMQTQGQSRQLARSSTKSV